MNERRKVFVSRTIAAPAPVIFDLLADPRQHHLIDGSGSIAATVDAPARLSLGATFSMSMRQKVRYPVRNVVCAFEENRVIAWHHVARFIWRYDLEPVEGGTRVTESFDYSPWWGILMVPFKVGEANRHNMERSLERLDERVTQR
jgi:uncharacterized protein YndB with AHSA1/START domain